MMTRWKTLTKYSQDWHSEWHTMIDNAPTQDSKHKGLNREKLIMTAGDTGKAIMTKWGEQGGGVKWRDNKHMAQTTGHALVHKTWVCHSATRLGKSRTWWQNHDNTKQKRCETNPGLSWSGHRWGPWYIFQHH